MVIGMSEQKQKIIEDSYLKVQEVLSLYETTESDSKFGYHAIWSYCDIMSQKVNDKHTQ